MAFEPDTSVALVVLASRRDDAHAAALAEEADQVLVRHPRAKAHLTDARLQGEDMSVRFAREPSRAGVGWSVRYAVSVAMGDRGYSSDYEVQERVAERIQRLPAAPEPISDARRLLLTAN